MIAKYKTLKLSTVFTIIALLAVFLLPALALPKDAAALPFPKDCPGGSEYDPSNVPVNCSTIPVGCPGSTQQAQTTRQSDTVPENCPYESPNGNTGTGSVERRNQNGNGVDACGGPNNQYWMSIDIGCQGKGNPIMDATFAIIRFLSYGVGLVLIASLVFAGIQYTTSKGDPKSTAAAITRIRSTVGALLLFIFGFALLNYIIPSGVLK